MDTTLYGTRSFNTYNNTCYDNYAPISEGNSTHIDVTHKQNDINLIDKSWLNVEFSVSWSTTYDLPARNADGNTITYFLGWKNAPECIRRIEVLNGDRHTGYMQLDNDMETFLHHTRYTTAEDKRHNPSSHATFENVNNTKSPLSGTYFTLTENSSSGSTTISLVIPLTDIPALRYFKEFPACFGPLTLKLWFNSVAMVIHQGNVNKFYQAGVTDSYYYFDTTDNTELWPENTFTITSFRVTSCSCDVQGYTISQEGKQKLSQEFGPNTPYVIPGLHSIFKTYDGNMQNGQFNIEFAMAVHNVKDIHLQFPISSSQRTCFQNPMLQGIQLKIHNVHYPRISIRTDTARFVKLQVNGYEPDDDYWNSLLTRNDTTTRDDNGNLTNQLITINNYTTDNTSFILTIPMERENEPNAFDGYETGDENVNFNLVGRCIYDDEYTDNNNYTFRRPYGSLYYNPMTQTVESTTGSRTETAPFVWFTSKVFWTADTQNGLVFHEKEVPNY